MTTNKYYTVRLRTDDDSMTARFPLSVPITVYGADEAWTLAESVSREWARQINRTAGVAYMIEEHPEFGPRFVWGERWLDHGSAEVAQ